MDNNIKDLLSQVVNGIVNEDDDAAAASFKQYATLKVRGIVEGEEPEVKAVETEEVEAVDGEDKSTEEAE